jgi:adenosylcobinamide kinase/adenosylcobinamide-phosphate guanylyltransferase
VSPCGLPPVTLILGGARSGKSRYAESLVEGHTRDAVYLATARPSEDPEMDERIRTHRERRGSGWHTVEAPLDLVPALRQVDRPGRAILVDCLTLWASNLMAAERSVAAEGKALIEALPGLRAAVVFVSNEVGLGIVPVNALARGFRDQAGMLHQALAAAAQSVIFMAAGLPLHLKSPQGGREA